MIRRIPCIKSQQSTYLLHQILSITTITANSAAPHLYYLLHHIRFSDFSLLEIEEKAPFKVDEKGELVTGIDNMVSFKPKLNIPFNEDLDFVNEFNGLVLFLSSGRGESWVVCNLLTGEQVIVDQFHQPCSFPGDYVLGCCPVSNQFKVLRRITMENVAEIKTLGTDEWRTVKTKSPIIKELGKGVFLHGLIHKGSSWENRIWSFHFGNQEFLDFPIPNKLEGHSRCLELTTFVLNSCHLVHFLTRNVKFG